MVLFPKKYMDVVSLIFQGMQLASNNLYTSRKYIFLTVMFCSPQLQKKTQREIRSLENINKALKFIQNEKGVNLEGLIGSRNIYEGDVTMILGLVWTLILRLQISEFELDGVAGEKGLLLWCQRVTKGYPKGGQAIKNFSRSWKSGLPFVAIIHHFRPDIIEFNENQSDRDACETAFAAAESIGIVRILDVEDICDTPVPDKKIVMTYIAEYFKKFAVMEAADSEFFFCLPSKLKG